jgi:hypothetical protein
MLSLLSLSFCSCTAQAQGYYTSTYSGGTTTVITTSPPSPTQKSVTPYSAPAPTNAPGSWGGGSFTYIDGGGGSGSVTCAGEITATFIWNGGTNNDPAPTVNSVVVSETVNAAWQTPSGGDGSGTGTSGGGSDIPNGGTPASQPPNYTATRYTANGGSGFSVNATPSAFMSGSSPHPYQVIGGNAYVGYVAAAFPVTVSFAGTTLDSSHKDNILVGQGCTASLAGVPTTCKVSGWQWTVGGNTFQSWNGDSGTVPVVAVLGPGPVNQATAHWYWSDTAGNKTVTCTATVTPPVGQGLPFSITATKQVSVQRPAWVSNNISGLGYILHGTIYALQAAATPLMLNQGFSYGASWRTAVSIPTSFSGYGQFSYAQLITPEDYLTPYGGTEIGGPNNGHIGLDQKFPYLGDQYTTDNNSYNDGDSPAIPLNFVRTSPDLYGSVRMMSVFKTYLMFKPPGTDVKWVPLAESDWHLDMGATRPNTGHWSDFPVTQSAGSVDVDVDFTLQTTHPYWTQVF